MAQFGKRNAARDAGACSKAVGGRDDLATAGRPGAGHADLGAAIAVVKTGKLPPWVKTNPMRLVFVALLAAGAILAIVIYYGVDVVRDHRLAGTWQPAYDMQNLDGMCTSYNLVATVCDAKIASLAEPGRAPVDVGFVMLFANGGGESLVPVRSTVDPSAVSVAYAAETELTNRTITFIAVIFLFAMAFYSCVSSLLRGQYEGGAAHRALMEGFAELKARVERAETNPHAAA